MKEFTQNCGVGVLVDDAYATFEVKASTIKEAYEKAYAFMSKANVYDEGSLEIHMDVTELAKELGNLASEDNSEWEPVELTREINALDKNSELYNTLEWIVCNAN